MIFHFPLNLLQHIAHATYSRVVFNLREKVHRDVKEHCEKVTFIHVMLLMFMMSAVSRLMSTISLAHSTAAFIDEIWAACRRRRLDLCDKMWSKEWGKAQLSIKSPSSFVFFNFQIDGYHQAERVTWTVVKILLSYLAGTTSKGGFTAKTKKEHKMMFHSVEQKRRQKWVNDREQQFNVCRTFNSNWEYVEHFRNHDRRME